MIFTINHIDPKSNSQSKTKFFSRTAVTDKEPEPLVEDFARISSLGIILSRSGLDNKRSRVINSGDAIEFQLLFSFNADEELLVKGAYKVGSGQLNIEGHGKIRESIQKDTQNWQKVSFYMYINNVQPKRIHMGQLKPNVHDKFLSLCNAFSKGTKRKKIKITNDAFKNKVGVGKGVDSDQLLEEFIYNIFAIGQLSKFSLEKIENQLNGVNEHLQTYSVNVEKISEKTSKFKWEINEISDPELH